MFASRWKCLIVVASMVVFTGTGIGLVWLKTEVKVGRYFPDDSQLVQDSRFFESNIGGTSSVDVLIHLDHNHRTNRQFLQRLEFVWSIENRIREHASVAGAISLADFQPTILQPPTGAPRGERFR